MRRMGVLLQNEILRLCAKEVLQGNPGTLASFTWKKLLADMEKFAPTLLEILKACTKKRAAHDQDKANAIVGLCTALLCKHRHHRMSAVQKIVSLVLYAGHFSKKVL